MNLFRVKFYLHTSCNWSFLQCFGWDMGLFEIPEVIRLTV